MRIPRPSRKHLRRAGAVVAAWWVVVGVFNVVRPLPDGLSVEGPYHAAPDVEFLYDLTYERDGQPVVEQQIFDRIFRMVDEAERFIVVDMFLFNGEHGGDRAYPRLSGELTDRLVARAGSTPDLAIEVTTDEINTFYGAYEPDHFTAMRAAGIRVVTTDLTALRDSNPAYSAGWRIFLQWFGSRGSGFLPHPLTSSGQTVTARSYLRMFNMKANHRKLIVTDQGCLLSSANPHDASGFHSNIAWYTSGDVCNDVLGSERGIASFSGVEHPALEVRPASQTEDSGARVRFLSEGKIRSRMVSAIDEAAAGDAIDVAMFYLSDRQIVESFARASERGVRVRLILDPNKDAFGREKGGIPNRQVALELDALGNADVRWYDTHGEQFHTKLVVVRRSDDVVMFGGSSNLTRRNLGDYNIEADLEVVVARDHRLDREVAAYFDRLWNDQDGHFTLPFDAYRDGSLAKRLIYRFQEFTGLSSF